jgi:hypothetical protein
MFGMTNSEEKPPPVVGAYWIDEKDYPALLRIFADGNRMPRTWKEWLKMAEEMEQGLKAYGHVVMRVRLDPNTYLNWCAAHDTSPGGAGRKMFVAAAVAERYGDQN